MHPFGVHMHTPTGYAFRNVNTCPNGACVCTPRWGVHIPFGGPKGLPEGYTSPEGAGLKKINKLLLRGMLPKGAEGSIT